MRPIGSAVAPHPCIARPPHASSVRRATPPAGHRGRRPAPGGRVLLALPAPRFLRAKPDAGHGRWSARRPVRDPVLLGTLDGAICVLSSLLSVLLVPSVFALFPRRMDCYQVPDDGIDVESRAAGRSVGGQR